MMPLPPTATIYWQHTMNRGPGVRVVASSISYGFSSSPTKNPRLGPSSWFNRNLYLTGDFAREYEPFAFPATLSEFMLPAYLAREYFRNEPNDGVVLSSTDPEIALGRALVYGESVCCAYQLPSVGFLARVRKWGARVVVNNFLCNQQTGESKTNVAMRQRRHREKKK